VVRQDATRGGGTTVAGDRSPLDWQLIAAALEGRTIGRRVIYHASAGSTNDEAKRLAAERENEGTVVLADEQTAGRGRAGKSRWITPANTSVAVSVLLRPALPPERLGALAMIAGLVAVEGVRQGAAVEARLKWPNDVLVGTRKLGGILVESALSGAGIAYAVIGIGLNGNLRADELGALPDAALEPATLLEVAGRPVGREAVIVAMLKALDTRYAALRTGAPSALRRDYRAALSTIGQTVTVSGAGESVAGVAEDVTDRGALVLRLPSGRRREFAYGEVSVRTALQRLDP
jgi:BirA family transcriptional regulator, biotin operon repressor / biotin---[acetyl-CoA-carboxylase] ligase